MWQFSKAKTAKKNRLFVFLFSRFGTKIFLRMNLKAAYTINVHEWILTVQMRRKKTSKMNRNNQFICKKKKNCGHTKPKTLSIN